MKIVIDTNVVTSGLFFGGRPRELLDMLLQNEFESFVSDKIVAEYQEIFDRMRAKYQVKQGNVTLPNVLSKCTSVEPTREINVCRDPDDNKFIECAVEAKCIYIVSGDKDLLTLEHFEDVEIVTVAEFFEKFYS
ncbi:MAG: putative toxin-antitoxin system toxin component, PIN family [Treponema sp.]|nr:putative toxin-antitoxin system toxin component, PIN family [Treponema sp.]